MTDRRWERVERLYHAALERQGDMRVAFLDEACAGDPGLREELDSLLRADADGGSFLEQPAVAVLADGESTLSASSEHVSDPPQPENDPADAEATDRVAAGFLLAEDNGPSLWDRLLVVLACSKVLFALGAISRGALAGPLVQVGAPANSLAASAALVVSFGACGLFLIHRSHVDPRGRAFGIFLLLVATPFTHVLVASSLGLGLATTVFARLRLEMFLPTYFWLFVRDFPLRAPLGLTGVWPARLVRVSAIGGGLLFGLNAAVNLHGAFWPPLLMLMLPVGPAMLDRARFVGAADRRRVWWFIAAICGGLLPLAIDVLLRTLPWWNDIASRSTWIPAVVLMALLSVPWLTAYSVLVDRVFDANVVARAALQYALARLTLLLVSLLPIGWALWASYQARSLTLAELVADRPLPLGLAALTLAVILPMRQRLGHELDRRFFRAQYETDAILGRLVEQGRTATSVTDLARLMAVQLGAAFHPTRLAVLVRRDDLELFDVVVGVSRSLRLRSSLVRKLAESDAPLVAQTEQAIAGLREGDGDAATWLADGDFRVLIPLRGHSGTLHGIVALGERRSETPYSGRDLKALSAIGATGGVWMESHMADGVSVPGSVPDRTGSAPARECPSCGLLHRLPETLCTCGTPLREGNVPAVLAGKFVLQARIGAGGMGVVYRGVDLELSRPVAVKALRGPRPRDVWRIRREARTMALVTDANLATVYGLEFWFGRPFLIVEYLAGGTLADRLFGGRTLSEPEVLAMGLTLARVLERLHASRLLHRDIKPANIGFNAEGVVKLLDFGLARQLLGASGPVGDTRIEAAPVVGIGVGLGDGGATPGGRVVGTPLYMSPEALRNDPPDQGFDLWSLAVTLFEALAGVNPYARRQLFAMTTAWPAPDPRDFKPCSAGAAAFFAKALSPKRAERPATAQAFGELLRTHLC
ncbi:MAG: serine/threonine-protein kinase [Vicinamibacterales bacterium]